MYILICIFIAYSLIPFHYSLTVTAAALAITGNPEK